METLIIFGGILGFIIGMVFLGMYLEKKRREGMERIATERGWKYFRTAPDEFLEELSMFKFFQFGSHRKVSNLILGLHDDATVMVFDYWASSGGKNNSSRAMTVFFASSDSLNLPRFSLRTETFLDRMGIINEGHDIDFDDFPEFSGRYLLLGEDEDAVRQLFSPDVIAFFEKQMFVSAEGEGDRFVYYGLQGRIPVSKVNTLIEQGIELSDEFIRS